MSHGNDHEVHVIGYGTHSLVYIGLVVLTGLTVAAAGIDVGSLNLLIAMFIASIKASLVLTYFMHLKYENAALKAIVLGAIIFMFVVFCLTFVDYFTRVG